MSRTFRTDTTNILGIIEDREAIALHNIHQLDKLHTEAQIRFVATIIFHSILPSHTQERLFYLYTANCLEQMFRHSLKSLDDIFLFYKTHLAINLRKLRLAVGTQVFITKTFHNLEITVKARHHQQLFESLRRLGQGIELSRIHTGRNHKITCALRCRLD